MVWSHWARRRPISRPINKSNQWYQWKALAAVWTFLHISPKPIIVVLIRVFHDKQIWQKICQSNIFWKNKLTKKSFPLWDLNFQHQLPLIWSLTLNQCGHPDMYWMGDFSNEFCVMHHFTFWTWVICGINRESIILTTVPFKQNNSAYNSLERSPIQHMSGWPHWLGNRLQMSGGCC